GVRLGDGAEERAHAPAHRGGPDPLSQGSRRATEPPQALGLVFSLARRLDQSARNVHLWIQLLPVQAGAGAALARAGADVAALARQRHARADHVLSALDA